MEASEAGLANSVKFRTEVGSFVHARGNELGLKKYEVAGLLWSLLFEMSYYYCKEVEAFTAKLAKAKAVAGETGETEEN